MTTPQEASPKLQVKEVKAGLWADFEKLFQAKGAPRYCWCMAWRADQKDPKSKTGAGRKAMMTQRVADGTPVGLLGYLQGEPVAWCSIAPFDTFHGLRKTEEPMEKVWSVTCFFVLKAHRGQGLTRQLLAAAVRQARKHGAKLVEGYAVDPDSPSYRHMGFVGLFTEAGFTEAGREGTRRHIMQLPTRPKTRGGA